MHQEQALSGEVFIVDDDPAVRQVLMLLFSRKGYDVTCFAEGAALLAAIRTKTPLCVILDVHIPGRSGLDILKEVGARYPVPIFMISGKGDIAMAVDAIKSGALDFIEKPFRGANVVSRIEEALAAARRRAAESRTSEPPQFYFPGREPLTARERDVLTQLIAGATNKEAGRRLGISFRTIEIHRKRIMEKLGARTAGDLIRIAVTENQARHQKFETDRHLPIRAGQI
ncbi:MAG TPA: response regulator [Xanthobacteraceae bacterium]|jgi:FixJ family two-component response regulator|nr:response regulator [Xanthobacteraceae bacterium]